MECFSHDDGCYWRVVSPHPGLRLWVLVVHPGPPFQAGAQVVVLSEVADGICNVCLQKRGKS